MKDFEISQEQLDVLMDACKPVPMIALNCGSPRSPQENANFAWERLGKELGFDYMTVSPNGKGDRFFSAEPYCVGKNCTATKGIGHSEECKQEYNNTINAKG